MQKYNKFLSDGGFAAQKIPRPQGEGDKTVKKLPFFDGEDPPSEILWNFRAKAGRGMHFQPQIKDLLL